ncbi:hypothetical protein CRG98_034396 [Punica granatum]|uniref:Uncharacterized protein n=1 Tax=Punica granatum TaxID=22663 RepID=A0A2I0IMI4_PUNGR|nr:hypothetical protein CRG98_034396 [Punica granatum]
MAIGRGVGRGTGRGRGAGRGTGRGRGAGRGMGRGKVTYIIHFLYNLDTMGEVLSKGNRLMHTSLEVKLVKRELKHKMRIMGMTMWLMQTSLEVGLVKRELKHKILEACMFRVGQSHGRRPNKSNKLWRAC